MRTVVPELSLSLGHVQLQQLTCSCAFRHHRPTTVTAAAATMALVPLLFVAQTKRARAWLSKNQQPLFNATLGVVSFSLAFQVLKKEMIAQDLRQKVADTAAELDTVKQSLVDAGFIRETTQAVLRARKADAESVMARKMHERVFSATESAADARRAQAKARIERKGFLGTGIGAPSADGGSGAGAGGGRGSSGAGADKQDMMSVAVSGKRVKLPPPPPELLGIGGAKGGDGAAAASTAAASDSSPARRRGYI